MPVRKEINTTLLKLKQQQQQKYTKTDLGIIGARQDEVFCFLTFYYMWFSLSEEMPIR